MTRPNRLPTKMIERRLTAFARGRVASWIGFAMSGLALAAFLVMLAKSLPTHDGIYVLLSHWQAILGALILYCLTYVGMTRAWTILARACGAQVSDMNLTRIFLISQIAKYLPGNVGQFIGRAWAGQRQGIPLTVLGKAMALEVAGVLAACSVLAGLALSTGLLHPDRMGSNGLVLPAAIGAAAVTSLVGSVLVIGRRKDTTVILRPLTIAILCYLLVFALMSAANVMLLGAVTGRFNVTLAGRVAGAFTVSWLVGFITPGAPAGLGLRELSFFSILAGTYSNETLLLTAAAFRLVTITGDLLAWMIGLSLSPEHQEGKKVAA